MNGFLGQWGVEVEHPSSVVRACVSQLPVGKCGAINNPIFVYVLVIVRVAYIVVFGLDLGSHRTVIVYSSL
ncbi:hypothetical protein QJS10_CPA02g00909 [Acorus calamus]|uniref:Transmembrane protein n=1 Tax=Acorus calamus TaxID=4465 RepID=A0AAV9FEE3_ACOCL|nr:hypothetical protein QJS10_CPA02g00909 [Acorus calamus]